MLKKFILILTVFFLISCASTKKETDTQNNMPPCTESCKEKPTQTEYAGDWWGVGYLLGTALFAIAGAH